MVADRFSPLTVFRRCLIAHFFACLSLVACGDDSSADAGSSIDAGADATSEGDAAITDAAVDTGAWDTGADTTADDAGVDTGPEETQVLFPRTGIDATELAVLINDDDPQSVRVGEYYAAARSICLLYTSDAADE